MAAPRIYCPELTQEKKQFALSESAANHIHNVLRLKSGDKIEIFDGNNLQCQAGILTATKTLVEVQLDQCETFSRESPITITLAQAVAKGDRMDWILQKATELGVTRVLPFFSQRTVVKLDQKRLSSRVQHWQGILAHACEQCGRNKLPTLYTPVNSLADVLDRQTVEQCFYFQPTAETKLSDINPIRSSITLIIGPEGGFSADELELARNSQATAVRLGPRTLRTETAGVAALAAIGVLAGDL